MDWFRLVGFFAIGKICIYILQIFPPTFKIADGLDKIIHQEFFGKLVRCNLCLGVWVYAFWVLVLKMYPADWYVPVISEFTIGASASFAMSLLEVGWYSKFGVIQVGG
jgi:hypothetical protein